MAQISIPLVTSISIISNIPINKAITETVYVTLHLSYMYDNIWWNRSFIYYSWMQIAMVSVWNPRKFVGAPFN